MSQEHTIHPQEKLTATSTASKVKGAAGLVGVVLLVAAFVWGIILGDDLRRFLHSYLISYTFFLSMAIGALFFVVLQHLVNAHWSITLRRTAEVITRSFPLLLVLSLFILIPLWAGNESLYLWSDHDLAHSDHLIHHKGAYFNPQFFSLRVLAYLIIFTLISNFYYKRSVMQDEDGDPKHSDKMKARAPFSMIVFAFTCAFTGFDLLMSTDPRWFSTMYGVYFFAGCAISIMALLVIVPLLLQRSGSIKNSITVEHYHDVGKLLFAFVFFWGYVAFSQFMLIWAANIPEETTYYWPRWFLPEGFVIPMFKQWKTLSLALIVGHFAIPFLILMSRHTKRKLQALAAFSVWMLGWHWIDLYWQVMPSYGFQDVPGDGVVEAVRTTWEVVFHPIDLMIVVGIGCLFISVVASALTKVNLIPIKDPKLSKSLGFENY